VLAGSTGSTKILAYLRVFNVEKRARRDQEYVRYRRKIKDYLGEYDDDDDSEIPIPVASIIKMCLSNCC